MKLVLVAAVLTVAAIQLFAVRPALERALGEERDAGAEAGGSGARPALGRLSRGLRAEVAAGAAVLAAAGVLATLPPAERPGELARPQVRRADWDDEPLELMLEPGPRGAARLEVRP